ncbi:unnamed protein product, partial [Orchesella dallaii]
VGGASTTTTNTKVQRLKVKSMYDHVEDTVYTVYLSPLLQVPPAFTKQLHFEKYDSISVLHCERKKIKENELQ